MKLFQLSMATFLALGLSVGSALAHDDKYFDSIKSPHGGQTRMAGAYHLELVLVDDSKAAKENSVTVYVTDHAGKAISTKGATANLILMQGSNKTQVVLVPEGENRLVGKANYASNTNLKAALSVTMEGKGTEQARFTPFAKPKTSPAKSAAASAEHGHHHH